MLQPGGCGGIGGLGGGGGCGDGGGGGCGDGGGDGSGHVYDLTPSTYGGPKYENVFT